MGKVQAFLYSFKRSLLTAILALTGFLAQSQNCELPLNADTLYLPEQEKVLDGESVTADMKNGSKVKIFRTASNQCYLKIFITTNFYFNKTGMLEIRSGRKSYYAKNTKQYKLSKNLGMYVIEIFRNYVGTLKDEGITSLVFAETETDFTRQDASQVRKAATCMYTAMSPAKTGKQ